MRSIHASELMQTVPSFSMNLWDDSQDYTFEVPAAAKQLNAIRATSSTSVSDALAPWEDHPTLMVDSWILAIHVCTVQNANSLTPIKGCLRQNRTSQTVTGGGGGSGGGSGGGTA